MTYVAVVRDAAGVIRQVLVTREHGRQVSQQYTGVVYRSEREAREDLARLNCGRRS